jgi:hypothetical protein
MLALIRAHRARLEQPAWGGAAIERPLNRSGRVGDDVVALRRGPAPLPLPQLTLYATSIMRIRSVLTLSERF